MKSMGKALVLKKKIYKGIEIELQPRKMKRIRIVYSQGRFILRYPKGLREKDLDPFFKQWGGWIEKQYALDPPHTYDDGDEFFLLGGSYVLERKIAKKSFCQLEDKLYLHGPEDLSFEKRRKVVEDFLREEVKKRVKEHLPSIEKMTRTSFKEVKVKKMKKWARCHSKSCNLSLSIRSIALDDELFQVLLLHELLHIDIPNHSSAFYEKMESYWPGSVELNNRIRRHKSY